MAQPGATFSFGDIQINGSGHHSFPKRPPPHDPDFVDRRPLFNQIREKCSAPASRIALVGLGGVGKSHIAIEHCYRIAEQSPETWVFWVHASNAASIKQGYQDIADQLGLAGWKDPQADVFQLVYNWLRNEENGKWLLVLDNADDTTALLQKTQGSGGDGAHPRYYSSYLSPSKNGSVLVTSRKRSVASQLVEENDIISIGPMDSADAQALLRTKLGEEVDENSTAELAKALDFMPLALVHAAAYIRQRAPSYSVQQYLEAFHRNTLRSSEEALAAWKRRFPRRQMEFAKDDPEPFKISGRLGGGGVGIVHGVQLENIPLALKRTYAKRLTAIELNEIKILGQISEKRHIHIVELIGSYVHRQNSEYELGLLIWPVAQCDLAAFLLDIDILGNHIQQAAKDDYTSFDEDSASVLDSLSALVSPGQEPAYNSAAWQKTLYDGALRRLCSNFGCIAGAVAWLHDHQIRHKDLKPSQILLSSQGSGLWLTDFGWSKDMTEFTNSKTSGGDTITLRYHAPERTDIMNRCGLPEDVFSLGCVFLEMGYRLARSHPGSQEYSLPWTAKGWSFQANLKDVEKWLVPLDVNPPLDQLSAIVKSMLNYSSNARPTIDEVIHVILELAPVMDGASLAYMDTFFGDCCASSLSHSVKHNFRFQPQHLSQIRQGQQPAENVSQTSVTPSSQNSLRQFAYGDPQMALWTVKKGKHSNWLDVKLQQQHVSLPELQDEVDRISRSDVSIERTWDQIPPNSARKIVRMLINEQNQVLARTNQSLQWEIAGIELEWTSLNHRIRKLMSMNIFLKTRPTRGLLDDMPADRMKIGSEYESVYKSEDDDELEYPEAEDDDDELEYPEAEDDDDELEYPEAEDDDELEYPEAED